MAFDLKAATPTTPVPTGAFVFGADSQDAAAPAIYSVSALATKIAGTTDAAATSDKLVEYLDRVSGYTGNMFNYETSLIGGISSGNYIDSSFGQTNIVSDFMPVVRGGQFIGRWATAVVNYYDIDRNWLSSGGALAANTARTVPADCAYIRTVTIPGITGVVGRAAVAIEFYHGDTLPVGYRQFGRVQAFNRWRNKVVGFSGDSITVSGMTAAGASSTDNWPDLVARKLGAVRYTPVASLAASGTTAVNWASTFAGAGISAVDTLDLLHVSLGSNDWKLNVAMGSYGDAAGVGSFHAAVRQIIERVFARKADLRVTWATPIYRQDLPSGGSKGPGGVYTAGSPPTNSLGLTVKDYATAIKAVCADYGVKVLDLYSDSAFNHYSMPEYVADQSGNFIHPLEFVGVDQIVNPTARFLEGL